MQTILRIAVFSPLRKCFDYLPPPNYEQLSSLEPGVRIQVPFGTKSRIGILCEITHKTDVPISKLKACLEILETKNLFSDSIYQLIHWASNYYHWPIGEVFETALPVYLRTGKKIVEILKASDTEKKMISSFPQLLNLNREQQQASERIIARLNHFQPFLLEGITGSGKTEVYLSAIEAVIKQNKQALILVPEIGLIPQMKARLECFSLPIAVLHSGVTEKQRFLAWQKAKNGEAPIVLGTRSAVFTPLLNPGILIVDEEHDASFKQQDHFRYSARDLILKRGSLEHCPVVLGSATPSLETLHNTERTRYQKLCLPKRANEMPTPPIKIIDIRHKKLDQGLSLLLIKHIQHHLDQQGQVLLFLNRRGFAPVYMCFDCGHRAECKHCDAKLTYHFQKKQLRCHHCESILVLYKVCPSCQSQNLHPLGLGTERLEAVLQKHFPTHPILRIDRDTTQKKGSLEAAMEKIKSGEAHILLGTQMLAKGHHFPNLTLVAILDIDNAIFSLDFRSIERLGQLLTQVAGRAGRAHRLGEVLLQSCHPEHPLLQVLLQKGYSYFSDQLLQERKLAKLPPFSHQALIRTQAKKSEQALEFLHILKQESKNLNVNTLQILGPVFAPMERKGGKYQAQLLLQAENRGQLQNLVKNLIEKIEKQSLSRSLQWSLDVDPIEMF